tara:strand:+ start:4222 stop:4641 length:420 start_codon:yes stop_codon:yes gene_type:complete
MMPAFLAPLAVYVVPVTGGIITGAVAAYFVKTSDGAIAEVTEDAALKAVEAGAELIQTTFAELAPLLESAAGKFKEAGLDFLRYAGPAVITGVENTYNAARGLLRGKEDEIIAGFTVGFIAVLTIVYLYQSVKTVGDAV